jgi:hypothetical protein
MPTPIERILDLLPHTFRARPRPTALHALADAYGGELLAAENALAEVLRAHWVDHADRDAAEIDDLARIAALYGLTPRDDPFPEETVEEFREHLKRYVRTFLEGTSTVRGVLRVSAETLGLRLDDRDAQIDAWWRRADDSASALLPRGEDAAARIFGAASAWAVGRDAVPARVAGPVLPGELDLRAASTLVVSVDGGPAEAIDLAAGAADPARATLAEVVAAVEAALPGVARAEDGRLVLASPTAGATGRLEVRDHPADAAPLLLGRAPRACRGSPATTARITGARDLSGGVALNGARYLRMVVDGAQTIEPDLDPSAAGSVALAAVVGAIDAEAPGVASVENGRLVLASPTLGAGGSLAVQAAASNDAADAVLGPVPRVAAGRDPAPALLRGRADLSAGLSLAPGARLRVAVDGGPAVEVDLAAVAGPGADPAAVAQAITAVLAPAACAFDGRFLRLVSAEPGTGSLDLPPVDEDEDAAGPLFGIGPRTFRGAAAEHARLNAGRELEDATDVRALHRVGIAVDGGAAVEVDFRAAAAEPAAATRDELRDAINAALGAEVASHDGARLTLASPTRGAASRIDLVPLERTVRRRFVTRAAVADDAARAVLGFQRADVRGTEAVRARITGTADLSRGADLSGGRFLRISVDGAPAVEVDCTGARHPDGPRVPRPRNALLDEVVRAIGDAVPGVAWHDGTHLSLTSPTAGAGGSLALEAPRAQDAMEVLLGVEPGTWRGSDAARVTFAGAARVAGSVDLEAADHVKVGVDGDAVEVALAGADPAATSPAEIVGALNAGLGKHVAHHDGRRILLVSPSTGAGSRVVFETPAGPDATRAVFGVSTPRQYRGPTPAPAVVAGARDLSGGADLRVARFLRLSLNGAAPVDVDCARGAPDAASVPLAHVVAALDAALGAAVARDDAGFLRLESPSTGSGARITLLPYTAGDARPALLGGASAEARGTDAAPAAVEGAVDMLGTADLSLGGTLRVAVDGGRPVDVAVAGEDPGGTTLAEVVEAVNRRIPGLARVSERYRLLLTSPTRGPAGRIQVFPARVIEVAEYPPEPAPLVRCPVVHGGELRPAGGGAPGLENTGAAEADAVVEVVAPLGAAGPGFVDLATGNRVRLLRALDPGRRVRLRRAPSGGLTAVFVGGDGEEGEGIPGAEILAGPGGRQAFVPFSGVRAVGPAAPGAPDTLSLDDPESPAVVVLRALSASDPASVEVKEAALPGGPPLPETEGGVRIVARLVEEAGTWRLVDGADHPVAHLRPGPSVHPQPYRGRAVIARGRRFAGEDAPLLVADSLRAAFDVTVRAGGTEERWAGVVIGGGGDDSLARRVEEGSAADGSSRSTLVRASEVDKGAFLSLPRGRSRWRYLECAGPRFGRARFDQDRFPGGACLEEGIWNVSRFAGPYDAEKPVFAPWGANPPVEVSVGWTAHLPGAFEVHLPADLPAYFGGRFNEARFGGAGDARELFQVVTEPAGDPDHLVRTLADRSLLVDAEVVDRVPIGWTAVPIPTRRPRVHRLRRGRPGEAARLYLRDPDVPLLVEVRAREPGDWGNGVEVSVRPHAPGRFELAVGFGGARFECARAVVRGGDHLPPLGASLTRPGPLGLLHARAAGIAFRVAREGAWTPAPEPFTPPKGTSP